MKARLPDKELNEALYREGLIEGITFVADTIVKLVEGSTDNAESKLDTILMFCKNSIKINEESKTNKTKSEGDNT